MPSRTVRSQSILPEIRSRQSTFHWYFAFDVGRRGHEEALLRPLGLLALFDDGGEKHAVAPHDRRRPAAPGISCFQATFSRGRPLIGQVGVAADRVRARAEKLRPILLRRPRNTRVQSRRAVSPRPIRMQWFVFISATPALLAFRALLDVAYPQKKGRSVCEPPDRIQFLRISSVRDKWGAVGARADRSFIAGGESQSHSVPIGQSAFTLRPIAAAIGVFSRLALNVPS